MHFFTESIINWYSANKRILPWRKTKDPYRIWLSEVILQQTRINQGISYYLRFIREFPTVHKLARAGENKILKLWQGLGYYTRARNLHATAKVVSGKYSGKFPGDYSELLRLKGIGDYTAAAISSIAFSRPHAVVDGNVHRLLSRYFGIRTPVNTGKGKKEFYVLANSLMDKKKPGTHNQAIMEFGSLQCKPVNPDCGTCILRETCFAYGNHSVHHFPVKEKKQKARNRYFNYLVIHDNKYLYLQKRTGKDIWKNLYDFPLIETDREYPEKKIIHSHEWKKIAGSRSHIQNVSKSRPHILSHQVIHARFWEIRTSANCIRKLKNIKKINKKDFHRFAVPRLIEKFAETFLKDQ